MSRHRDTAIAVSRLVIETFEQLLFDHEKPCAFLEVQAIVEAALEHFETELRKEIGEPGVN